MVENIKIEGVHYAIIIRHQYNEPGIHFFTENELSQQLGFMKHEQGKVIVPHKHKKVRREVIHTQEVLVIRSGKLRVDFYDYQNSYKLSKILEAGDVILLIDGGHGFEVLEDIEMFEIKQGPFNEEEDKVRFHGVEKNELDIQ